VGIPFYSTNKTVSHDITEILLKVAHNGALKEIETSQAKSEARFWRSCCVD
jgi:hypothetical protein